MAGIRLPGQSLEAERAQFLESAVWEPLFLAVFMIVLAGLEWWCYYTKRESTGRHFEVKPAILFPGWFVSNSVGSFKDIWVLEPKAMPAFLGKEPVRLFPEDVKLASFHLSRFIRTSQTR